MFEEVTSSFEGHWSEGMRAMIEDQEDPTIIMEKRQLATQDFLLRSGASTSVRTSTKGAGSGLSEPLGINNTVVQVSVDRERYRSKSIVSVGEGQACCRCVII